MIEAMPIDRPIDAATALSLATAKLRELRARAETAEIKLKLETARRVGAQQETERNAVEIHTQRKTILDQKDKIRALEDEIRRLKQEVAQSGRSPQAHPQPDPQADDRDATATRFSLIELDQDDP